MRVEFLAVGDELLGGFTIDTNSAHAARELAAIGVSVVRRTTVPDDETVIAQAVRDALDRTGAVLTSGGLGPTADDRTKHAVAAVVGRALVVDAGILADLKARWTARGWPGEMPEANRQQALLPEGAEVLPNAHGSAPGVWVTDDRARWVAMLPGPPREFRGMLGDTVVPRLRRRLTGPMRVVASRTLRTTGVAESALHDRLGDLARGVDGLPLAFLPGTEGVDLRVTVRGVDADAADGTLARAMATLRAAVGDAAYGEEDDDLAAVVLDLLRDRGRAIAVAESCTGGLVGTRLTAVPGSSDVVRGGVIAYHDDVKAELLGVDPDLLAREGAVSEAVARALADGARTRFGTGVGVGVTGVAGPDGGSADKPVGTVWIAVDLGLDGEARRYTFPGDRDEIRRRAAQAALDLVRRALLALHR